MKKKLVCIAVIASLLFVPPLSTACWAMKIDYGKRPSGWDIVAQLVIAAIVGWGGRLPAGTTMAEYVRTYTIPKIISEAGGYIGEKYGGKYGRIIGSMAGEFINAKFFDYQKALGQDGAEATAEKAGLESALEKAEEVDPEQIQKASEVAEQAAEKAGNVAEKSAIKEAASQGLSGEDAETFIATSREQAEAAAYNKTVIKTLCKNKEVAKAYKTTHDTVLKEEMQKEGVKNSQELVNKAATVRAATLGIVMLAQDFMGDSPFGSVIQFIAGTVVRETLSQAMNLQMAVKRDSQGKTYQSVDTPESLALDENAVNQEIASAHEKAKNVTESLSKEAKETLNAAKKDGQAEYNRVLAETKNVEAAIVAEHKKFTETLKGNVDAQKAYTNEFVKVLKENQGENFQQQLITRTGMSLVQFAGEKMGLDRGLSYSIAQGTGSILAGQDPVKAMAQTGMSLAFKFAGAEIFGEDNPYVSPMEQELFFMGVTSISKGLVAASTAKTEKLTETGEKIEVPVETFSDRYKAFAKVAGQDFANIMADTATWGLGSLDDQGRIVYKKTYDVDFAMRLGEALDRTKDQYILIGPDGFTGPSTDILSAMSEVASHQLATEAHVTAANNTFELVSGQTTRMYEEAPVVVKSPKVYKSAMDDAASKWRQTIEETTNKPWEELKESGSSLKQQAQQQQGDFVNNMKEGFNNMTSSLEDGWQKISTPAEEYQFNAEQKEIREFLSSDAFAQLSAEKQEQVVSATREYMTVSQRNLSELLKSRGGWAIEKGYVNEPSVPLGN